MITQFMYNTEYPMRTIKKDSEPWFVAKDVCDILGLNNVSHAMSGLEVDEKNTITISDSIRGNPTKIIVSESGLYELIFKSRKPEARSFRRWVTSEILPSIRKDGGYLNPVVDFTNPTNIMKILTNWENDRKKLEEAKNKIEIDAPKVEYHDAVANTTSLIKIGDYSKFLEIKGMNIGRNNLFKVLRRNNFLMANNIPYQKYIDLNIFKCKQTVWRDKLGNLQLNSTTYLTGKGQGYLYKKLKSIL